MDDKRLKPNDWTRYVFTLPIYSGKKVKEISFDLKADDFTGEINVTDLQLQSGSQVTVQVPHTSEFLFEKRYGIDENSFIETVGNAVKKGVQPINYTGLKNRIFNITGRGHEVIALPNVFHEDYKEELLTSGLDLELYAKEDFDLLRISSMDGALVPEREYNHPALEKHPLNYKYTREFYFEGGKAGQKISLSATLSKALIGSKDMPIGQRSITVAGKKMKLARQKLMMAPFGSFRLRVEFYKKVTKTIYNEDLEKDETLSYLEDVGIGFYGNAQFTQVTGNHKF